MSDTLDDFFVAQQVRVAVRLAQDDRRRSRRLRHVKPDTNPRYAGASLHGLEMERSDETAAHTLGPRRAALDEEE